MDRRWHLPVVLMAAVAVVAGGPIGPSGGHDRSGEHIDTYSVGVDPAQFTTEIDNPFLSLRPGTRWVYEGKEDSGKSVRTVIEVTSATRRVMGVECVVVRETASVDGQLVEDTFDWYAQDAQGNVWYFGENGMEYEDGRPVTAPGDWEAGVAGAKAGIVMKANAQIGDRFRQEFNPGGEAEMSEVVSIGERATGRLGTFDGVLLIRDSSPLEPDVVEHKYFAPGVGMIREVTVKGGSAVLELVEMTRA